MRAPNSAWIWALGFLALAGCGDDKKSPTGPPDGPDQIVLQLENFGDPSPYHFALWAVAGGETSLLQRFGVSDGAPVTLAGDPIVSIEQKEGLGPSDRLLLSLESDTLSAGPGPHRFLAGEIAEDEATLTLDNASAIGANVTGAAGYFLFDAPTTATTTDCGRGVWWTDGAGAAGLTLPVLASGWSYEGWVIDRAEGAAYSTGRFQGPTGADDDGAGPTGGGGSFYPFPGQDFVAAAGGVPVLDVDDGSFGLAVTLEPDPDLAADPFFLKLLEKNAGSGNLLLTVSTLPRLPDGMHYEIWAVFPDSLVSVGKFLYRNREIVDPETLEEIVAFPVGCNLRGADAVRISVESDAGAAGPSGSFLLAGTLVEDEAALTSGDPLALGHSFQETDARYILETPSTFNPDDYNHGIWFYEVVEGETTGTLPFPPAPDGWRYGGWIARVFGPLDTLSVGTFVDPQGADDDGAGPFGGTDGPLPAFPGEDFVTGTSLALDNGTFGALLSLEPAEDGAPGAAFLPIFEDNDIAAVGPDVTQPLGSLSATFPTGSIRVETAALVTMNGNGSHLPRARVVFGRK